MGSLQRIPRTFLCIVLLMELSIYAFGSLAERSVALRLQSVFRADLDNSLLIGYDPRQVEMIQNKDWEAWISFWRPVEDGSVELAQIPDNVLTCSKKSSRFVKNDPKHGFICEFDLPMEKRRVLAPWHMWGLQYHFTSGDYEYSERLPTTLSLGAPSIAVVRRIESDNWGSVLKLNVTLARPALAVDHKMDPSQYDLKVEFFCDALRVPDHIVERHNPVAFENSFVYQFGLRARDYSGAAGCVLHVKVDYTTLGDLEYNSEKFRLDITWQAQSYSYRLFGLDTSDEGVLWNLVFFIGLVAASVAVITIWDCICVLAFGAAYTEEVETAAEVKGSEIELASHRSHTIVPAASVSPASTVVNLVAVYGYPAPSQQV